LGGDAPEKCVSAAKKHHSDQIRKKPNKRVGKELSGQRKGYLSEE